MSRRALRSAGRSPRGRGRRWRPAWRRRSRGSIPAWAGETQVGDVYSGGQEVDPRVGGGDGARLMAMTPADGRSPRGRGRRCEVPHVLQSRWSIPAWAGETQAAHCSPVQCRVDPRVGGGDGLNRDGRSADVGRSPRGRGRRGLGVALQGVRGSIPAWAGETAVTNLRAQFVEVDPRVGGGDRGGVVRCPPWCGRSPRGRGRRPGAPLRRPDLRSIPAWAGETVAVPVHVTANSVDPRVGGGDPGGAYGHAAVMGRSPRGRGRRDVLVIGENWTGSIPAWAGETLCHADDRDGEWVDPRVGGGDRHKAGRPKPPFGRSPRGRGRPAANPIASLPRRSIPAWAGETEVPPAWVSSKMVDPRVGGGDTPHHHHQGPTGGRSPRGRGRPASAPPRGRWRRSIPAWAGETTAEMRASRTSTVDPRVGGGDNWSAESAKWNPGRSPRGRGRLRVVPARAGAARSIPAWAGETRRGGRAGADPQVDPRVGGGDITTGGAAFRGMGRSPRGRGRRETVAKWSEGHGSIPAWAGETLTPRWSAAPTGVDPRVGGGDPRARLPRRGFDGRSPRGRGRL